MSDLFAQLNLLLLLVVNGGLALLYGLWEHLPALGIGAGWVWLARGSERAQRGWLAGVGSLCVVAGVVAPAPVPVLLMGMVLAGGAGVALDRFNPHTLRWRVSGGLALYAVAALAYLGYSHYLSGVDAAAWASAIGGQDEAQATLAQGRAFLNTLATWGLWLILPLGYGSLLVQGLLAHPPQGTGPAETITQVRTRGR